MDEILAWIELSKEPGELLEVLIRYGVLEYGELLELLEPHIAEVKEVFSFEMENEEDFEYEMSLL